VATWVAATLLDGEGRAAGIKRLAHKGVSNEGTPAMRLLGILKGILALAATGTHQAASVFTVRRPLTRELSGPRIEQTRACPQLWKAGVSPACNTRA
jgi:hypothetical protein